MAIDPQQLQAAQAVTAKIPGGSEILKDVATAGSIIAAGSAVPVIGTIGGAVVAAVVVLGPKLFKGIHDLFGESNKWPERIKKLQAEPDPVRRSRAAWTLYQLASAQVTMRDPPGKRRWVQAAQLQLKAIADQSWMQLTQAQRDQEEPGLSWQAFHTDDPARYRAGPFATAQLEGMAAEMRRLLAAPPPGADAAGMARVLRAMEIVLAERGAPSPPPPPVVPMRGPIPGTIILPPRLPGESDAAYHARLHGAPAPAPAPPAATPKANPWPAWFVAALAAQKAGRDVPPPPPIPPVLPSGMPPMWIAWATMTRAAQAARLPPPFPPPPIPLPWAA